MAKKNNEELIISKIIDNTNYRTKEDINSWRTAITIAENIYNPSRERLIKIYDEVVLDTHVQGVVQQRINNIMRQEFRLLNDNNEDNEYANKLFNRQWFFKFLKYALESPLQGTSLVQLWDITENGYGSVQLVPRKNVIPNIGAVVPQAGASTNYYYYREQPYSNWLVEIGDPDDLGLFVKAAPAFIIKKNAMLQWSQYTEIFGMPLRVGTTTSRTQTDMDRMARNLRKMGQAAYGVFQQGEEVKFIESTRGDAYNVYDKLIERCNSEISKLIVGQTMTTDNGSSKSQGEVHERVADNLTDSDKRFIAFVINDKLIPLMISHGFKLNGVRFEWAANIDTNALFEKVVKLLPYKDVPDDFIDKTFGIPVLAKAQPVPPVDSPTPDEEEDPNEPTLPIKGEKKKTNLVALSSFYDSRCPKCGGKHAINLASDNNSNFSVDIDALAKHIYDHREQPDKIHIDTFLKTSNSLISGFSGAFEKQGATGVVQGYKSNIFAFSAAKTFTEMNVMREALHDGEKLRSFGEFKKAVAPYGILFNRYTQTEYNYCIAAGQMADRWQSYMANQHLYPNLRYVTVGDGRVREQHAIWNNKVFPITNPFWATHYPPNDWGCRCDVEQEDSGTTPSKDFRYDPNSVPLFFRNNVGQSKVVFNPDAHPYFTNLSASQKKAADIIVEKTLVYSKPREEQFYEVYKNHKNENTVIEHQLAKHTDEDYLPKLSYAQVKTENAKTIELLPEVYKNEKVVRKKVFPDYDNPTKNPDFRIDGEYWEFKMSSERNLKNHVKDALEKTGNVILYNREPLAFDLMKMYAEKWLKKYETLMKLEFVNDGKIYEFYR